MFHIVAASSLFHSINTLNTGEKKQYESLVTAIPSLSLNNNLLNQGKNLRRLLEDSPLKEKKVVVWHDVVNNTIRSHRTNNYRPAGVEELTNYLKTKKQQILAIVYCRREGTLIAEGLLQKGCSLFQLQNDYSPRASKTTRSSSRNI